MYRLGNVIVQSAVFLLIYIYDIEVAVKFSRAVSKFVVNIIVVCDRHTVITVINYFFMTPSGL